MVYLYFCVSACINIQVEHPKICAASKCTPSFIVDGEHEEGYLVCAFLCLFSISGSECALFFQDQDDHDGRVSFKDFQAAVFGDKLLLESLGQCLPDEKVICIPQYSNTFFKSS